MTDRSTLAVCVTESSSLDVDRVKRQRTPVTVLALECRPSVFQAAASACASPRGSTALAQLALSVTPACKSKKAWQARIVFSILSAMFFVKSNYEHKDSVIA